jgi:hypothetical protein
VRSTFARVVGLGGYVISAAWVFRWEAVRAFLYDRGFHVIGSLQEELFHWGIPAGLVLVGSYLFWFTRTSKKEATRAATIEATMPIIAFFDLASKQGWQVRGQHNFEALDLLDGLVQAGANGSIHFQGRRSGTARLSPPPLIPIDQMHWHECEFDPRSIINVRDNTKSCTRKFNQRENRFEIEYTDVHLDSTEATRWVSSNAALAFKGQTERKEQEREERRRGL